MKKHTRRRSMKRSGKPKKMVWNAVEVIRLTHYLGEVVRFIIFLLTIFKG